MKTGKSLVELAQEIQRQSSTKRDFVAPTTQLEMVVTKPGDEPVDSKAKTLSLRVNGQGSFGVRRTAHTQIANRLGVPVKYYERMRDEAPELLATNVNHWLASSSERRLVRTLDGNARAFLSSRYRTLDNFDLAETVLPVIHNQQGMRIESAEITESRLYLKVVTERVTAEIRKGDVVQAGIVISNSEIGFGSVKVEPLVFRLVCLNGMIANDASMRKYHVGRGAEDSDLAQEFFKDETRRADDVAFWLKVRDVVKGAFDSVIFERIVNSMRESTERKLTADPVKAVEVTQKQFGLNDTERGSVLTHLIREGDLTQYGLMNAMTRASQDVDDYDRATELERMGGQVIELGRNDWRMIAEAA